MTWRKAWARTWDDVRWCSDGCRARGLDAAGAGLEAALLGALRGVRRGALLDPETILTGEREAVRRAARRLAACGAAEVVQAGRVVDPSRATGPMLLRLTS